MEQSDGNHAVARDGLTIAPSLDFVIEAAQIPPSAATVDRRVVTMCILAIGIGLTAGLVAHVLMKLIIFITNFAFHRTWSLEFVSPADNQLGIFVIEIGRAHV